MRATVMHGAGDVRVEDVPDARVPDGYRAMDDREAIKVIVEL